MTPRAGVRGRAGAHPRLRVRLGAGLVVLLVLLAGCGGKGRSKMAAPGSSTTIAAPATFPLTGLPSGGAAVAGRPALSVKIDNIAAAQPQAGLNSADVVVEQPVEGGLTRRTSSLMPAERSSDFSVRASPYRAYRTDSIKVDFPEPFAP